MLETGLLRFCAALAFLLATGPAPAAAEVFLSKQEALASAFPEADRVDHRSFALSDAQAKHIETLAQAKLESRLVTLYSGWNEDRLVGYALIDMHQVRTLPEAFMVVLSPEGEVRSVRMLAFYEPPEYRPPDRWLRLFEGYGARGADESSTAKTPTVHGIAGSTLSSRAVTGGVRRSVAIHQTLVLEAKPELAGHTTDAPAGGGR